MLVQNETDAPHRIAGAWRLLRRIRHPDGAVWTFAGEARIGAREWRETGMLTAPGGTRWPAERRYLLAWDGAELAVRFEDGRPFHRIAPTARPVATHVCAPDLYRVAYRFGLAAWASRWTVTGPRKGYTMTSLYGAVARLRPPELRGTSKP